MVAFKLLNPTALGLNLGQNSQNSSNDISNAVSEKKNKGCFNCERHMEPKMTEMLNII